jgi:hypothetical protein
MSVAAGTDVWIDVLHGIDGIVGGTGGISARQQRKKSEAEDYSIHNFIIIKTQGAAAFLTGSDSTSNNEKDYLFNYQF